MQAPTSTQDRIENSPQSLNKSARTGNDRASSQLAPAYGSSSLDGASKHSTKSRKHHAKEPTAQSLLSTTSGIALDLQGLTLDSHSSNASTFPSSLTSPGPLEAEDDNYQEYHYPQSTYLSPIGQSYAYPNSVMASSRRDTNPIERYLEEDVTERYSIFSVEEEGAEPLSASDNNNHFGYAAGSPANGMWRYS